MSIHHQSANPMSILDQSTNSAAIHQWLTIPPIHHHSAIPMSILDKSINPSPIRQSITNLQIHHHFRQFNVNPSPIHQFISNPSIHHQSANPSPIQSQPCVNPSIQRFDKLINMAPINGQSHASTIKNSIDTGSARIGTHHANPLPIGGHFRK